MSSDTRSEDPVNGRPLRVAHVLPAGLDPLSGVATAVAQLAVALADRCDTVELWMLHRATGLDRRVYEPVLRHSRVSWILMTHGLPRHLRELTSRQVDVVHLHSVFSPRNAMLAAQLRHPYVLSPHGGYAPAALDRGRMRKRVYGAVVETPVVRRAAACVALTDVEAQQLSGFTTPRLVHVIPNGVSAPEASVAPASLRAELGVDDHQRLALFVGRLDVHHKGLDRLVHALAGAPEWHAVLVGGDARNGSETLARLARDEGVRERLHIIGPRTGRSLEAAFAAADLLLLASRWEGLPMALLEAMARGVPALVSPEVEAVARVARSGAGWAAPAADMGRELRRLGAQDPQVWQAAGNAARALASTYSWARSADAHASMYVSLLSRASSAHAAGTASERLRDDRAPLRRDR